MVMVVVIVRMLRTLRTLVSIAQVWLDCVLSYTYTNEAIQEQELFCVPYSLLTAVLQTAFESMWHLA